MFSINRIYGYIFLLSLFPVQILNCELFKSSDELACLLLLALAGADIYANGISSLRKYKFLLVISSIFFLYLVYTLLFCHFNTPAAVLSDVISQIKPFAAFGITLALNIQLDDKIKALIKIAVVLNCLILLCTIPFWMNEARVMGHPANFGAIMMLNAWLYLYASLDQFGKLSQKNILIVIGFLIIGLFSTRSKYYGEVVLMLFLLFGYKSGMQRHIDYKKIIVFLLVILLILVVSWQKIHFYFIEGANDVMNSAIDEESLSDSFARPVLYAVAGILFLDYFPFGTGYASYASYASAESYSSLYYDYGLNHVYGLSPRFSSFICDAYYPTLAQFGVVGVFLFLWFWYWILRKLNKLESEKEALYKYQYILGIMVVIFVVIESIGNTFFIQGHGMLAMMFLAILLSEKNIQTNSQHTK